MKPFVYFDHAATTFPKPPVVMRAVSACLEEFCGNPGRSAHRIGLLSAKRVYEIRCQLAQFFGLSQPENLIFCANATWALNLVLQGVLHRGDRVLVSETEHNSVLRPLKALESRGVFTEVYPVIGLNDLSVLEEIRKRMTPRVRMIVANHVSNVTGRVLPVSNIGTIAREHHALFLVDGSQSAGVYPIHMKDMQIDYLCLAGHKSMFGMQGTGLCLIAPGAPIPQSMAQGGNGVLSLSLTMPEGMPEQFEPGTVNVPGIVSLGAGAGYIRKMTMEGIRNNISNCSRRCLEVLGNTRGIHLKTDENDENGYKGCTSVLSFVVEGLSPERVAAYLDENTICVRSGYHCAPLIHRSLQTLSGGTVRLSFSALNTVHDAEIFCQTIRSLTASGNG